uniref:Protein kinase domain-containing protein n=1 Tax=Amphimedon queenslandica TaxID=400682 RepID=A0A1X7VUJ2_AMPQE
LFCREMSMASQIRHPNLVQFIGATKVGTPLILTELMSTNLYKKLQEIELTNQQIFSIAQEVALGLNYLHLFQPQPIIHRDVSSPNILLKPCTGPAGYEAKCIKKPEAICQWPMHRYNHAGAIIIAGPGCFMLVISGGSNSSGDTLDDCWILNTTQFSWIKLDVPHSVSKRMAHSLSVYIMSPHCVWMLTVGGIIDDKCELVANPNIALLTKLVTNNKGEWIVTDTLDTNVINNKEYKKKYQEVALLARRVWLEEYQK